MSDEVNVTTQGDVPETAQSETNTSSGVESAPADESKKEPAVELDAQKQKGVDKRIANLTRQLRQTQERLAQESAMRQELSRVNYANGSTNESPALPKPDRSQFVDAFDYAEALIKWKDEERVAKSVKQQKDMTATQFQNYKRNLNDQHKARASEFKKVMPDFDDAMNSLDGLLPESHILAIQKSPYSAEIAYQLAKSVDDATEFSMLDPFDAAMRVGEMSIGFKNKPKGESHKPMSTIPTANSSISASSSSSASRIKGLREKYKKRVY